MECLLTTQTGADKFQSLSSDYTIFNCFSTQHNAFCQCIRLEGPLNVYDLSGLYFSLVCLELRNNNCLFSQHIYFKTTDNDNHAYRFTSNQQLTFLVSRYLAKGQVTSPVQLCKQIIIKYKIYLTCPPP